MWTLTLRAPDAKPLEYGLKPGITSIGRRSNNTVVIADEAASRQHAQINLDPTTNSLTIRDLGSTNGTFVNRQRITAKQDVRLALNDVIRIGMYELLLTLESEEHIELADIGFQAYSRELLLESFDNHAILLYEVIQQLNNIIDTEVALKEISRLLQLTLGADKCQVVLAEDFDRLHELGFPETIARAALAHKSTVLIPSKDPASRDLLSDSARHFQVHTALCVPVISADKPIALIYMYKTRSDTRHFGPRDMQLAVAVGHLAALTIERVNLLERVHEEQRIRQLLQRFVAPAEAEFMLRTYLTDGQLPELSERECTILFADIAGSVAMAERLGPSQFGDLLKHYYQDVTDIVFQFGGLLDKYLGDGVMAVFGMTGLRGDPETRAVSAGMEILKQLEARYRNADRHIDVGIGINSGIVVAGYVSTKERVELTVLGDTVNVAAVLESMARPNRILVGPTTHAAIGKSFRSKPLGPVTIKQRNQPVEVHEILRDK